MRVSDVGLTLIKEVESFREFAYPDPYSPLGLKYKNKPWGKRPAAEILATLPAKDQKLDPSPWTVGYGFTKDVTSNSRMSIDTAETELKIEIVEYEQGVLKALKVKPTQAQFDACVSLAWNIGVPRFSTSSVKKAHNRGDFAAASRAFGLFNKSRGKVSRGLTLRRAREASLYLSELDADDVPSLVDNEKPLTNSNINRASIVAGGTATIATIAEVGQQVALVKDVTYTLGDWLVPGLLVVVIAMCGYIVYDRYCQRKDGSR